MPSSLPAARTLIALGALALVACEPAVVQWSGDRTAGAPIAALRLAHTGEFVADSLQSQWKHVIPPGAVCPESVRLATHGEALVAVWWSPRVDSTAWLVFSRSLDDGATWGAVAPIDTLDRGRTGCRRVPPAIAADPASGYIHVSYALVAPEGSGIFFSHSMDRGVMFHAPVPIVYGDRLGRTSVAAAGDQVVVAFEDPNGGAARIGLALSRTMGHIFEDRLLPVSAGNGFASQPIVAIQGRAIAVAWHERAVSSGAVAIRVRTGTIH